MKDCTIVSGMCFDPRPTTPADLRTYAENAEQDALNAMSEAADYQDQARDLREQAQRLEATPDWWLKARRIYYRLRGPRTIFKL